MLLHVVIPLRGRFKGEKGERCHLIPMANVTVTNIPIWGIVELFEEAQKQHIDTRCNWAFINEQGYKLVFGEMNDIILDVIEDIKKSIVGTDLSWRT